MQQPAVDIFPNYASEEVAPVSNPGWPAFQNMMLQDMVQAYIAFMSPADHRVFFYEKPDFAKTKVHADNFMRAVKTCKKVKYFNPAVNWSDVERRLCHNPETEKKNSDQRLFFRIGNMWLVKHFFTFGLRKTEEGYGHLYQTSEAPMLVYQFNVRKSNTQPPPGPNKNLQCFVKEDRHVYDRYVMRPHSIYVVPPDTAYVILTVQKTLFALDIVKWEAVSHFTAFNAHTHYEMPVYQLPPPTPVALSADEPPVERIVREPVQISTLQPLKRQGKRIAHVPKRRATEIPETSPSVSSQLVDNHVPTQDVVTSPYSEPLDIPDQPILYEEDIIKFLNDFSQSCAEPYVPHPQEDKLNFPPDGRWGEPEKFCAAEGGGYQEEPLDLSINHEMIVSH